MEHQTLGRWVICPSNPANQRIILKIVGFLVYDFHSQYLLFQTSSSHFMTSFRKKYLHSATKMFHVWIIDTPPLYYLTIVFEKMTDQQNIELFAMQSSLLCQKLCNYITSKLIWFLLGETLYCSMKKFYLYTKHFSVKLCFFFPPGVYWSLKNIGVSFHLHRNAGTYVKFRYSEKATKIWKKGYQSFNFDF